MLKKCEMKTKIDFGYVSVKNISVLAAKLMFPAPLTLRKSITRVNKLLVSIKNEKNIKIGFEVS